PGPCMSELLVVGRLPMPAGHQEFMCHPRLPARVCRARPTIGSRTRRARCIRPRRSPTPSCPGERTRVRTCRIHALSDLTAASPGAKMSAEGIYQPLTGKALQEFGKRGRQSDIEVAPTVADDSCGR